VLEKLLAGEVLEIWVTDPKHETDDEHPLRAPRREPPDQVKMRAGPSAIASIANRVRFATGSLDCSGHGKLNFVSAHIF
jgi:hypothetical protein